MARQFLKVECSECGNEQKTFSHASEEVECLVCSTVLAKPTGGAAEIKGEVVEQLEVE
ncbi:MAG: 30S ribosomal protein S27e [Candidatus Nanohaloarchaea archaeon]